MTLQDLGYFDDLEIYRVEQNLTSFDIGRVITEHKERYIVKTSESEFDSELIGNLRFTAESRFDFPAVGDWVAFTPYDEGKALIHAIYPRNSIIKRKAVGKKGQVQIIATNIDFGLIVQAVDRDFNLNRLERYLTICNSSQVKPIIVLTKIDLLNEEELEKILDNINQRIIGVSIVTATNQLNEGYDNIKKIIQKNKTYCLLGSSGVGKSTLLNALSGQSLMETGHISTSVNKGRHITSHRELIVLPMGGILIDNPGMREVGIADTNIGVETTFHLIMDLKEKCRFKDCTHTQEDDCAIIEAVENGDLDQEAYLNFKKMEKEKNHFDSSRLERKKKEKEFGKMIKNVLKEKKKNKF